MKNLICSALLLFIVSSLRAESVKVQISKDVVRKNQYRLSGVTFNANSNEIKERMLKQLGEGYSFTEESGTVFVSFYWGPEVKGEINGDRIIGMEVGEIIGNAKVENKECILELQAHKSGDPEVGVFLGIKGYKVLGAVSREAGKKCLPELIRKLSFMGNIQMKGDLLMEETVSYTYEKASDLMGKGSPVNEVTVE
ncbi:MAG: hypothetical protein VYA54_08120 [Bdellovibrionota bacterium]|nr:hypothetical protein [Bdellovibrionota bacterium]